MNSSAPQIGFDRFVHLDWIAALVRVRAGVAALDELNKLLDASGLGKEARAKTWTKLNALGLEPRANMADFVDRGRALVRDDGETESLRAFAWGVAIATYPFFGNVAQLTGRLTAIQGDCSVSEIHRRMSETYGDREVTKRATQAVLQTQGSWGVLQRVEKGKRIIRLPPVPVANEELTAWLIEAAARYMCRPIPVPSLQSLPILFPFTLVGRVAYLATNSRNLELRSEGPSSQFVALRTGFEARDAS